MSQYLVKIEFDCNDADYVYGSCIVSQKVVEILRKMLLDKEEVSLGNSDWTGGYGRPLDEVIEITEITDEEAVILTKFGFHRFGEGDYFLDRILDDYGMEEDDEDE